MSFHDKAHPGGGRLGRIALALLAGFLAWLGDGLFHQQAAREALSAAGYGERITASSRPWRCILGRGTEFWAQGGRIGRETTGYVCTSHFLPPRIRETPDITFDPFRDI